MKTLMRYFTVAAALGVLLVLSGCFTTNTARNGPGRPIPQFTVVESSPGLEMTPQLLADLRESVTAYLKQEGLTRDGEYVVKVNLSPDQPEETGQWVVVKISSRPARTFTLLAAYPGSDDYYPYDFHGYYYYGLPDYYRYGYYDPFDFGYGYRGYYPTIPISPRRDHKPDGRHRHPPGTPTGWDGDRPKPEPPSENVRLRPSERLPRPVNYRVRPEERVVNPTGASRPEPGDYTPPPPPTPREPSPSFAPSPVRSEPPPPVRMENAHNHSRPQEP